MVIIREKTVADDDDIAEIVALATRDLRCVYSPTQIEQRTTIQRAADAPFSLVAIKGNAVTGVVDYYIKSDEIYVQGLAVHPKMRLQGIASALIRAIERIAINCGKTKVSLSTIKETGNPAIFEKLGFNVVSEIFADGFLGAEGQQVTKVNMSHDIITTAVSAI